MLLALARGMLPPCSCVKTAAQKMTTGIDLATTEDTTALVVVTPDGEVRDAKEVFNTRMCTFSDDDVAGNHECWQTWSSNECCNMRLK